MSKKQIILSILAVVVLIAAFIGYKYWKDMQTALPIGIASGNGRIEAKLVDVSAKESLRVKSIFVDEGDHVEPNQVLVQMDTVTLDAQLDQAQANVLAANEKLAIAEAAIVKEKSQIELAKIEVKRTWKLLQDHAGTQRDYDYRKTYLETSKASLAEEEARLKTAKQEVVVAEADAKVIQTRINDATLKSPVRGRVLYRLAEVGEVVPPGGKVLTLVNLDDVYMEIFLPSEQAAKIKIGAEARVTVDYAPGRAAAGFVSFVSPEAQFTPKYVETQSEREKLMFRVKIRLPEELISSYIEYIKTGVRGVGYVKVDPSAVWPSWLQNLLIPGQKKAPGNTMPSDNATRITS